MKTFAEHVATGHRQRKLRGAPDLSAAADFDVTPSLDAALSSMLPLPERPPVAARRWHVMVVDNKGRVAVSVGKHKFGWTAESTLQVLLEGMSVVLTDQGDDGAVAEVSPDPYQHRVILPDVVAGPLRMQPGTQVFVEIDEDRRRLRLHPAGVVERLAAAAVADTGTADHDNREEG